jgi:ATP-dependent helicase HrpB
MVPFIQEPRPGLRKKERARLFFLPLSFSILRMNPASLPIQQLRPALRAAAGRVRRIVIQAPTGSGKSTQVPQMLLDEKLAEGGEVIVLQPRRLAARLLAKRVAEERQSPLGGEVGFQIRFDRVVSARTRIRFVTEGILLRQLLENPRLPGVAAIVFDEFHERHLSTDLSLALARRAQETVRPDLLLVVMSATLDAAGLAAWLQPSETLTCEGRTYPIVIEYSAQARAVAEKPAWEQAAWHCGRLLEENPEGDCLIFMPGAYEISRTLGALQGVPAARDCLLLPLHGQLSAAEQDRAVAPAPPGRRKIIVSTNVAETSLTIDGVTLVVDAGLARAARFDPRRGIDTLLIENISQASADQRAGRAGRTAPGRVVRLWGEREHTHRPLRDTPEMQRVDLAESVLSLAAGGFHDLEKLAWLEPPPPAALDRARLLLRDLGALDAVGAATARGRRMAAFPVHPRYARMFLEAHERGCLPTVALLAAFTQGRNLLLTLHDPHREEQRAEMLGEADSDFFHLLRLWEMGRAKNFDPDWCRQWGLHGLSASQAGELARQFLRLAEAQQLDTTPRPLDEEAVRRCLLAGFSDQLALREDLGTLRCRLVHNRRGELRRQSAVRHARLLVAADVEETHARGEVVVLLSLATKVEEAWLRELFPEDFSEGEEAAYDATQKRVVRRVTRQFRDLVLESREAPDPPPEAAARLLAAEVLAKRIELKNWDDEVESFIARVNFAAKHAPELGIHAIDDDGRKLLIEEICLGASSARDLRERDVWPALRGWLSPEQQLALETMAPREFVLPKKRHPAVLRYTVDGQCILAAKVQELYDADPKKLRVLAGKLPVTIQVLAPNSRPVQITNDLAAFWANSYEQVKKDLRGRYPRHEWR